MRIIDCLSDIRRGALLAAVCWILLVPLPLHALPEHTDSWPRITAENAQNLVRLKTYGKPGVLPDTWSSNGKWVAATSIVGVFLFDTTRFTAESRLLEGSLSNVTGVWFAPDNQQIYACEWYGVELDIACFQLWDLDQAESPGSFRDVYGSMTAFDDAHPYFSKSKTPSQYPHERRRQARINQSDEGQSRNPIVQCQRQDQ